MKRFQLNNRGAALISVLVVTTFITILATTLLYTAAMNYQQKQTDYYNKKSFYETEKALDELKSVLVKDVQEAYITAYNKTIGEFLLQGSKRQEYFQQEFMKAMWEIWKVRTPEQPLEAVKSVMEGAYAGEKNYFYKVEGIGVYQTETGPEDAKVKQQKFALKGVQVKYTYKNYTTFLYTDICIEPPKLVWAESFETGAEFVEREKIAFTDCVSYVNWRKADYENSEDDEYKSIDIGKNISLPSAP